MSKRKLYAPLTLLGLLLVLTLASPLLVRWQLGKQLEALGAQQVRIDGLYLNIWSGYFRLQGLEATAPDRAGLKVGHFELDLEMAELFKRRLHLTRLQLFDTETRLIQNEAGLLLGPLQLPMGNDDEATPTEPQPQSDWSWGLSQLGLKNLRLEAVQGELTQTLIIDQANLDLLQKWTPNQESRISLEGSLNGSPLQIGSTATPLSPTPQAESRLGVQRLELGPLLAPWLEETVSAELSSDLTLGFSQNADALILEPRGSITLTGVGYGDQLSGERIHWQGSNRILLDDQGLRELTLEGAITLERGGLATGDTRIEGDRLYWEGQVGLLRPTKTEALQISLDASLDLEALKIRQGDQLALSNALLAWKGKAQVDLNGDALERIDSSHDLTLEGFLLARDDLQLDESGLHLAGALEGNQEALSFAGTLDSDPLKAVLGELIFGAAAAHWQGALTANLTDSALASLEGDARLEGVELRDRQEQPLASLKQLTLEGLRQLEPERFEAARLTLESLRLSQDDETLLTLEGAELRQLEAGTEGTAIDSLALGALATGVRLDNSGTPRHWPEWVGHFTTASAAEASAAAEAPASAPYPFSLGRLSLSQPARLTFTDSTVTPMSELSLTLNEVQLEGIDTTRSDPSPFSVRGQINRFGNLELAGQYALFAAEPSGKWSGELRQLELPPFSPYAERHIGYQLESGQLQLKTQGDLAKGQVESSNDLTIHKLLVSQQSTEEAGEFDSQLGLPLKTVISILTDADDDLTLEIPVSGSLDDPQFGYQSVINIVMTKVAKQAALGYLTSTLQPYGALISLTRMAIKKAGAIQLAPVFFAPGTTRFDAQATDYLGKLESMLKEREGIRLNICGVAVATDARELLAQTASAAIPSVASVAAPSVERVLELDDTQRLALNELAQQRADRVKVYLQERGIEGERLFGCRPEVDIESDERPRVMLGL